MIKTKEYPIEEVKLIRRRLMATLGKGYIKKFPKNREGMRYATIQYFLNTGRDTANGYIYRTAKKLTLQGTETDKKVDMIITIDIYGKTAERLAHGLMARYRCSRFMAKLHRELRLKGLPYSYDLITRFFNRLRDTTGGKLKEEIEKLLEDYK